MATCINCKKESPLISEGLGVCVDCIRNEFENVKLHIKKVHATTRERFGLPVTPPRDPKGIKCNICVNECKIPPGEVSYCGLRINEEGKIVGVGADEGNLEWYYDELPTNCVAEWACAGGTGAGYPKFAYRKETEFGYKNLAVFFNGCSFNCLFCQNWHWREGAFRRMRRRAAELAEAADERTSCICYFGGDPTPQLPFAVRASKLAIERNKDRILRICWETNGTMHPKWRDQMAELSFKSGGCIKFDLKAFGENLNIALCGVSNKRTLENFAHLAERIKHRPIPPFLVASTLLIPGYVDAEEVGAIAKFLASLDKKIPYSLLGFYPHFYMGDLPTTSRRHADECMRRAKSAGLERVRIGNVHLLGNTY